VDRKKKEESKKNKGENAERNAARGKEIHAKRSMNKAALRRRRVKSKTEASRIAKKKQKIRYEF